MKQKLMALLMVLLLICPAAMATETIPLPGETEQTTVVEDEDLVSLTEEELLALLEQSDPALYRSLMQNI